MSEKAYKTVGIVASLLLLNALFMLAALWAARLIVPEIIVRLP